MTAPASSAAFGIAGDSAALVSLTIHQLPETLHAADCEGGYAFLSVDVTVRVEGFHGRRNITMVPQDLLGFLGPLRDCQTSLTGEAVLTTLEDQFALKLAYSPNGLVSADGYLQDQASGNSLAFSISTDQSALANTLDQLELLCRRFKGF